ncbi:MAG: hypothetical protein CVV07_07430 [Gammaproteobacteria bacterium HGW-Gammaproteobacteria-11]|nr:MAG: hypothetical protein CVV07_07430 [Gammaproteobacteria bacterium HGW-Gammaproteobacteria-11]
MQPANVPLCLTAGTTHRSTLRIMQPGPWVYRAVTAIAAGAPVRLTVPGHGIESDSWHCWLTDVQRMTALNREPPQQRPHRVSVVDEDTLIIDRISATGQQPAGGELRYRPPVDLTGADVVMQILPEQGDQVVLELTLGEGLTVTGPGTIERLITPGQMPAPGRYRYRLDVTYSDGTRHRYWRGPLTVEAG